MIEGEIVELAIQQQDENGQWYTLAGWQYFVPEAKEKLLTELDLMRRIHQDNKFRLIATVVIAESGTHD